VQRSRVVVLAASTGGASALELLLPALGSDLSAAILIAQHMPAGFSARLAQRLSVTSGLPVSELEAGMTLAPGCAIVAAGGRHMCVRREGFAVRAYPDDGPPENSVRPSADVLLRSVVEVFGSETLAVVLTGVGCDGTAGCAAVRRAGGVVFAQDEASSAAWGMPGSAVRAGVVDVVAPLSDLGLHIRSRVENS
jgi:two-component system chemotaxis response regulator CheB